MGEHGGILENIESIENMNMGNMVNMNLVFSAIFREKCSGSGECLTTSEICA